jgi:4-hydroxybutyrate CoA-transferase
MDWKKYIEHNTCTAEAAVKVVKSGDTVIFGHASSAPVALISALTSRWTELENVTIVHLMALHDCGYLKPEYKNSFHYNGMFLCGNTRALAARGEADFTPMFLHQIPWLLRDSGNFPLDVALISVSPPDALGRVSLGMTVDYTLQCALSAKITIAVINRNMPYVQGGGLLDVKDIDRFVFSDDSLLELPLSTMGPVEKAIGRHIAAIIKDGDCLQIGLGNIPDAILSMLHDKKDLGIHSEMISDGVMDLAQRGVITCARKNLHPGKVVSAFALGSKKLYKWMDHNEMIETYTLDYVNDPQVIARNDNMVSINSAISVDLLGQVNAESIGTMQFSAVGGQVDFIRGARASKGGRSIIVLPATVTKKVSGETVSRICAAFEPGQPVTTTRHDVQYIVTEYGMAELWGKTVAQRAKALIDIAAPEFKEDLTRKAREIYNIRVF